MDRLMHIYNSAMSAIFVSVYWCLLPSFKISITSFALKLSSSVSWASYAYRARHCGERGLGFGAGFGSPPPGAGLTSFDLRR